MCTVQDAYPWWVPNHELEPYAKYEIRIEKERAPNRFIVLAFDDDVPDLFQTVPVNVTLILLSEHLSQTVLANIFDGWLPEQVNCLPPLMPRSRYRLHMVDPS